jgi:hypothetical protein
MAAAAGGRDFDLEPREVVVDVFVTKLLGKTFQAQKLMDPAVKKLVRFLVMPFNIMLRLVLYDVIILA